MKRCPFRKFINLMTIHVSKSVTAHEVINTKGVTAVSRMAEKHTFYKNA